MPKTHWETYCHHIPPAPPGRTSDKASPAERCLDVYRATHDDPDPAVAEHALTGAVLAEFAMGRRSIYRIAKDFGLELARSRLDIPASYAPTFPEAVCIELPDELRFPIHGTSYVQTVYVATSDYLAQEQFPAAPGRDYLAAYYLVAPVVRADGTYSAFDVLGLAFTRGSDTLDDVIRASFRETLTPERYAYAAFIVRCLLYLRTGQPDLRPLRAPKPPATQNPKKLRRWHREHEHTPLVDIIQVGYDWKKPRLYTVDGTVVSGHFRWQPYGPGREQLKLIWIDPHERHFRNVAANPTPTSEPTGGTP